MRLAKPLPVLLLALVALPAAAQSVTYEIDPNHTFPSFEADHMGMSVFRGKFDRSTGKVVLDKAAGTGTVEIEIDLASIDFGQDELNALMAKPEYFDIAREPKARYNGRLAGFVDGEPTQLLGELTLRGVTRPLALEIRSFKCMPHPVFKRDWCGADAYGTLDREAFGISAGKDYGFDMDVGLRIQVEAVAAVAPTGE